MEDLFYSVPLRKKGMKGSEERRKVREAVRRLAVHFPKIAFVVKSDGATDLQTGGR